MTIVTKTYDTDEWQLVPKVATKTMFLATLSRDQVSDFVDDWMLEDYRSDWAASLATAPQPPEQTG